MSLFDLTGKIALVTGGTKGIGLGIAQQIIAHGGRVIISGRKQEDCDAVAAELRDNFGKGADVARGVACDISSLEQIARLAKQATDIWGGVDILVVNAAKLPFVGSSQDTPPELFDEILTINLHHNFRLCHALRPQMAARGGGSIVFIGSGAGHSPSPDLMAYSVAKAGMAQMMRNLADEFAPDHIRVNLVAPGFTRSHSSAPIVENDAARSAIESSIPLGRIGEPEDIAGGVIFLSSSAGSYFTGNALLADGGVAFLNSPGKGGDILDHVDRGPTAE